MTGLRSRQPVNDPGQRDRDNYFNDVRFPATLVHPGFANICLCYVLVAALLTLPLALFLAIRFAVPGRTQLEAHYLYIRTTIALLVIGTGVGSLLILLGAPLSSSLMLGGLALIATTLVQALARCCYGVSCAVRRQPVHNPKSYLV